MMTTSLYIQGILGLSQMREKREEFLSLVMKHEEAHAIKEIKNLRKLYKNAINMRLGLGFFLIKEN